MADRMLQFIRLPQEAPPKREVSMRREDFAEIYADFDPAQAGAQSSRCMSPILGWCATTAPSAGCRCTAR